MKKYMEYKVEGRRPRRKWLENVEVNVAELEINKEDVHDRKKCVTYFWLLLFV